MGVCHPKKFSLSSRWEEREEKFSRSSRSSSYSPVEWKILGKIKFEKIFKKKNFKKKKKIFEKIKYV